MAKVENTDPRLHEVVVAMYAADLDYEDNKGNSRLVLDLAEKCREAQRNFRAKKAELEVEPTTLA